MTAATRELLELVRDGEDPVSIGTVERALDFLYALPASLPQPSIGAEEDGDVTVDWYTEPRRTLSVSINADGRLAWAGLFGEETIKGQAQFNGEVPQAIIDAIGRVYKP